MKPSNLMPTGICQRIQAATTVEEIQQLLAELDKYYRVSAKTENRAKRLATQQTRTIQKS